MFYIIHIVQKEMASYIGAHRRVKIKIANIKTGYMVQKDVIRCIGAHRQIKIKTANIKTDHMV